MNNISNVVLSPLRESIYIKPLCLEYIQEGQPQQCSFPKIHDSVAILIYNTSRKVFVFVKQFRPAIYVSGLSVKDSQKMDTKTHPAESGMTIELCAGVVDKNLPIVDIAREEVVEETGYKVDNSMLEEIHVLFLNGSKMTLYYCEVTDDMKVESGGGVDDELIEVVEMTLDEVQEYVAGSDVKSPPSFLACIYWYLLHKAN